VIQKEVVLRDARFGSLQTETITFSPIKSVERTETFLNVLGKEMTLSRQYLTCCFRLPHNLHIAQTVNNLTELLE